MSAGRKVVGGASVASFAAMVVAMGPPFKTTDNLTLSDPAIGSDNLVADQDDLAPPTPEVQIELGPPTSPPTTQTTPVPPTAAPATAAPTTQTTATPATQTTPPRSAASG